MLTCIRKALRPARASTAARATTLATIPPEDPAVYDMLCRADRIGVFQVESRAQMNMLPRLKPRSFYDLVIEVAIVRPGADPGRHGAPLPAPAERRGAGRVSLRRARARCSSKTLGVPLFQEQAMQIAIVGAGFTPARPTGCAARMATFKQTGTIHTFRERFLDGMAANGYAREFAERCFQQIEGFGDYGFPESHAASFALLVYASAWLKCHYPAVFACALLNSQPMGFYAPGADRARRAGSRGRGAAGLRQRQHWDNVLEPDGSGGLALRLGFRQIKAMREDDAAWIAAARGNGYRDVAALWRRAGTPLRLLRMLAEADAFAALGLSRRESLWQVGGDRRGRAAAALRRARKRGGREAGSPSADDARRGDRRRLYRAPAHARAATRWRCCGHGSTP